MCTGFIDTHTHYSHKRFDSGRNEIIESLTKHNILAVIEGAIDFESNKKMQVLCEKYPYVYMATGCHPNCIEEMTEEKYQQLVEFANDTKVIAIGETGLDYAREKSEAQIKKQKEWFERFIVLSVRIKKPLVIHCRDAYDDLIEIAGSYKFTDCPGVIHCFAGNTEQARILTDMGFYAGVNGMLFRLEEGSEVYKALKNIPLERIVFETDCPYLIPAGVPGKRNTSVNLEYIVEKFAELRGESPEYIRKIALQNTQRLYPSIKESIQ